MCYMWHAQTYDDGTENNHTEQLTGRTQIITDPVHSTKSLALFLQQNLINMSNRETFHSALLTILCGKLSIAEAWSPWRNMFDTPRSIYASLKIIKVCYLHGPRIMPDIISLLYKRDYTHKKAIKCKNGGLQKQYKQAINNDIHPINVAQKEYCHEVFVNAGNSTDMWKTMKNIIWPPNSNSPKNITPKDFNNYFSTIGTQVAN